MTKFLKKSEISTSWVEIDAKNAVVGRLAAIITKILRGKNKTTFSPHVDHGDFVIVKKITPQKLSEKNKPEEILKLAVKRMLPGGVLAKNQLKKLKIYSGEEHPHSAQNPKVLDLTKINSKNTIRN